MGIINDRRPRDWTYVVSLDKKTLPSLQQMIKQVNETHDTQIIEEFHERCEQRIKEGDPAVIKSKDLVVNTGLQSILDNALGVGTRMQFMGVGSGTTAATVSDTVLQTPSASGRIDMNASGRGWMEPVGMKMFYGAIGNEQFTTFTIREFGIFNASSGGTMLNRVMFTNNALSHVINVSHFYSSVIEFCPVT